MKYFPVALLFVIAAFFNTGCEEIPPTVTPFMGETPDTVVDVTSQQRQVLIEEFTGVRCVQCPAGAAEIETLLALHGDQLVAVAIHAGDFSPPYPDSEYDFRTPDGDQLINYVGVPFGYPSAVVNRKLFDGENDLQLGKASWAGFIADEMGLDPEVKIGIDSKLATNEEDLTVEVTLFPQMDLLYEDLRLTVLITEDNIEDLQLTPSSSDPDPSYKHKHVLRDVITPYDGMLISEALVTGAPYSETFTYKMPAEWVKENCNVVAFISRGEEDFKDVLQVHEVDVVEQ
jgi:hypothetical protein